MLYQPQTGNQQVIVAGSYRLSGYDVKSGKEIWWVRRLPWQIKPTPVIAGDVVYLVTYSGESNPGEQEIVPPFKDALAKLDLNKDGKLSKDEIADTRPRRDLTSTWIWTTRDIWRNGTGHSIRNGGWERTPYAPTGWVVRAI